jgi:AraC family transcriptional regulator
MNSFNMDSGSMVLPLRNVEEWAQFTRPTNLLTMHIRDEAVQAAAREVIPASQALVQPASQLDDPRIAALMNTIDAEQTMGSPAGKIFMDTMEQMIATLLLQRSCTQQMLKVRGGLAPFRRRTVIDLIETRLHEPLGLADLAKATGLSQSHFSQMFRPSMGLSPHQYVLRQRVERAQQQLRNPNYRIIDIALRCGFSTQQHFSRIFRMLTGITPSEYRNNL